MLVLASLLVASQLVAVSTETENAADTKLADAVRTSAAKAQQRLVFTSSFDVGRQKEGFFGSTNILLGIGMFSGASADMKTTFMFRNLPESVTLTEYLPTGQIQRTVYTHRIEDNWFTYPFVAKGQFAGWSAKMTINGSVWVLSYHWRCSDERALRVVGWIVPIMFIVGQNYQAYLNYECYRDYRDAYRRSQQMPPVSVNGPMMSFTIKW